MHKRIILHRGKDKPIRNRAHWIFPEAIKSLPRFEDGDILPVFDFHTQLLGYGYFNRNAQIVGRMISFEKGDPIKAIKQSIRNAYELRLKIVESEDTDSFRLISGEADNLPGLVVDKYADVLVLQISTLGMERIKDLIVSILLEVLPNTVAVYERSDIAARAHEGLPQTTGILFGKLPKQLVVEENGIVFEVDVINGHKTGFYLDQREMRRRIAELTKPGHKLLNCFSYTGGFSAYAAKAGAITTSVDISAPATEATKRNFKLNDLNTSKHEFLAQDVFDYLDSQEVLDFDIVILDPPAFAKKREDIPKASGGYRKLNQLAIEKAKPSSLLLTCSCSFHIDEQLFQSLVTEAALKSKRKIRIIGKHILAADHAMNIYSPEQGYLKSLLLFIE